MCRTFTGYLDSKLFWQPDLENFNGLHAPVYCFLVSHGNRDVVFDLGVRLLRKGNPLQK